MDRVNIILLGYKAHSGKDTLADYLEEEKGFIKYSFAKKLKSVVADLYGFTHEQMYGELKNVPDPRYIKSRDKEKIMLFPVKYYNNDNNWYILRSGRTTNDEGEECGYIFESYTPREILQDFGQEQRKRFPDIWADYVCRGIVAHHKATLYFDYVISDFRFPNEYEVCKRYSYNNNWNVIPIRIDRLDELRGDFAGANNISETALDDFSHWKYYINNDATIEDLYKRYNEIVKLD